MMAKSRFYELRKEAMPNQMEIIKVARRLLEEKHKLSAEDIKQNFDDLILEIEKLGYKEYLKVQEKVNVKLLAGLMSKKFRNLEEKGEKAIEMLIEENFDLLDDFFKSLGQSRKSRAGRTFEENLKWLLKKLDYPFEERVVIDGRPDFLFPSVQEYHKNPMNCIIFTAKRTLRERWRQIVTEGTRGLGFFLATLDDKISVDEIVEMKNHRIHMVIPSSVKDSVPIYKNAPNVISFKTFFKHHLDPAMKRW